MKQQIFDRYFAPMRRRADLSSRQEAVVEFAFDLALSEMEAACLAANEVAADANARTAADVQALEARIQDRDGELLYLTTLEDRLTQWLSSRGVMLSQYDDNLYAAIVGTAGNEALLSKLQEAQNSVAYLTDERNRLKRQLADLENTIEAVRDAEQLLPLPPHVTIVPANTATIIKSNGNGHAPAVMPVVENPKRIDFAGSNEELRQLVVAAFQLFHKQNGRAPSHADWKQVGPAASLPSANTIENRLGLRWSGIAKAAGLEPNAKFNARSEVKAEDAEATFPH